MSDDRVVFACESPSCEYRVVERSDGALRFQRRRPGQDVWQPIGMRRTLRSVARMIHGDWPPERVDAVDLVDGRLEVSFSDVLAIDERPLLARWRESRWIASLAGRRWVVRRLAYIESLEQYRARMAGWGNQPGS